MPRPSLDSDEETTYEKEPVFSIPTAQTFKHQAGDAIHSVSNAIATVLHALSPINLLVKVFNFFYGIVQFFIILLFKPKPPKGPEHPISPKGRIAVIGAGLTGVSSACHAIAHNFDVVLYEKDDKVGGIWAHVNSTSGLQLNSMLYRFHPGVKWSCAFPHRDEILSEIERLWKEYQLEPRTKFNTPVTSVKRAPSSGDPKKLGHARWLINGDTDDADAFDAIIVTVGTCGDPQYIEMDGLPAELLPENHEEDSDSHSNHGDGGAAVKKDGQPHGKKTKKGNKAHASGEHQHSQHQGEHHSDHHKKHEGHHGEKKEYKGSGDVFKGQVVHSSQLDEVDLKGKTVVVLGSGASGVEAVELAIEKGAASTTILARDDKWIIPRNMFFDTMLSAQPFGRQTPLSFVPEWVIRIFHYRGLKDLAPPRRGIFEGTPVVNDTFLEHIRQKKCTYLRADTQRLTVNGVLINDRSTSKRHGFYTKPGDEGEMREVEADVVVMATGFKKPAVDFLPEDLFPEDYARPNLYLQNFSTEDWSVLLTNSSYVNAIGTVGHFHIGIYTRILLTLLMDEDARPTPKDMKLWVDALGFVKRGAHGGPLSFFTYMELTIWLIMFHVFRPDRIRWIFFIMQGWGVFASETGVPQEVKET